MTQTAALAGNDQRLNFLNVFIRPRTHENKDALPAKTAVINPILDWFEKSSILQPVEFKSIPAGKIFQSDRAIVKFRLSGIYHEHFVLFRGLLEFSRPKQIAILFDHSERTFELFVGTDQAPAVTEYLDLMLRLLIQEIKFKKSLKAILRFEESVRTEQSRLYSELKASVR